MADVKITLITAKQLYNSSTYILKFRGTYMSFRHSIIIMCCFNFGDNNMIQLSLSKWDLISMILFFYVNQISFYNLYIHAFWNPMEARSQW